MIEQCWVAGELSMVEMEHRLWVDERKNGVVVVMSLLVDWDDCLLMGLIVIGPRGMKRCRLGLFVVAELLRKMSVTQRHDLLVTVYRRWQMKMVVSVAL